MEWRGRLIATTLKIEISSLFEKREIRISFHTHYVILLWTISLSPRIDLGMVYYCDSVGGP
jgi:hypothetical protein